ncbi:MAG: hypothetical protein IIV26_08730 [Peptococcaceae bacterium]|nr:hypothetical protein [Peptococcaceae bacterium]
MAAAKSLILQTVPDKRLNVQDNCLPMQDNRKTVQDNGNITVSIPDQNPHASQKVYKVLKVFRGFIRF